MSSYITQPERSLSLPLPDQESQKQIQLQDLDNVSLRNLRQKKKQTDKAIQAVQARINYMKVKEETSLRKVFNVRKRVTDMERVRKTTSELKQMQQAVTYMVMQALKREQEEQDRKIEFNKLLREHLECNKKIVYTILNEKIKEEAKKIKTKNQELELVSQTLRQNLAQDNFEKANKVRQEHLHLQEKKRIYFLDKLKNFKDIKEEQLKLEMKVREQHENKIQELEQKEALLLDRLNMSERFKMKCQEEYKKAKQKYHSFYENTILASRRNSLRETSTPKTPIHSDDTKCNIFIS